MKTFIATFLLMITVLVVGYLAERQDTTIVMPTIVSEEAIAPVLKELNSASYGQVITLKISGYGGDVATGLMLDRAIQDSKAKVILRVEGLAMSMYADLVAHAKHVEFAPGALLMFHGVQTGEGPFPANDPLQIYFTNRDAQTGLFTNEEICFMRNGGEIYMTEADFWTRLETNKPFTAAVCENQMPLLIPHHA
jgi:hypothetical protein